jgi:putative intracellular protease/amidase
MKVRIVLAVALVGALAVSEAQAVGPAPARERNVAVLIFPGVQIIDYTGPWEVLGHATVDGQRAFRIYSVAATPGPITTSMGMSVNPTYTFADAPKPDVLVVPGGGVDPNLENAELIAWIRASAKSAEVVLSVCNGAFFLARAGLLDGLEATTFAGLIEDLQAAAPKTRVVRDKRFVVNGKIVTAAGLSSGIDGALHVIEKLYGKGAAQVAAVSLEYDWRPDSGWARASLADRHVAAAYGAVREYSRTVVRHEGTRERWETCWDIRTTASAADVLGRFDAALSSGGGWTREKAGKAGSSSESHWRFQDETGAAWAETTRIEPLKGQTGLRVTVTVARAARA